MAQLSQQWFASIAHGRNGSSDPNVLFKPFPLMPWLHPRLHPALTEIIQRVGLTKKLSANENLFPANDKVDHLVYVQKGVTGRSIGDPNRQAAKAIAFSTPGHIAAGNLNIYSARPAIGRYFAITDAELIYCPRDLFLSLIDTDEELKRIACIQFECCSLSDRLGFCCMSLLGAEDRMKALLVTWACNYGELVTKNSETWIKSPTPLPRQTRAFVGNTSLVWLDKTLKLWKDQGVYRRKGEWVYLKPELIDPVYKWMRQSEEKSDFTYPESISDLVKFETD